MDESRLVHDPDCAVPLHISKHKRYTEAQEGDTMEEEGLLGQQVRGRASRME